jgi:CubicO group peptidase (beta-lactamase class C family)
MMTKAAPIVALALALAACGAAASASTFADQLAANERRHGVVGQAVLVMRDDQVLFRGVRGMADAATHRPIRADDVFPVFSVAKLFTSTLVMQLVERGEVDPSQPISRYVADLPERWRAVTVQQLLDHVSGLPDYFEAGRTVTFPPTAKAMFASLADRELAFAPGTQVRYTQTNYVVLGQLLEAHYHKPYRQIATEQIIAPLGLTNTYFGRRNVPANKLVSNYRGADGAAVPDRIYPWPEYSYVHVELFTTLGDLGAFVSAVRRGGFAKPETVQRMWRPYRLVDGGTSYCGGGWEVESRGDERRVGHDGGEVVRAMLVFTDSLAHGTYTYIYLTNGSASNVWTRTLIESLMPIATKPH